MGYRKLLLVGIFVYILVVILSVPVHTSYVATQLIDDEWTIALYHFDGDATDSSSNGFHGTAVGSYGYVTDNVKVGTHALQLSGVGTENMGNVSLPNHIAFAPVNFSFEAWIYPNKTVGEVKSQIFSIAFSGAPTQYRYTKADGSSWYRYIVGRSSSWDRHIEMSITHKGLIQWTIINDFSSQYYNLESTSPMQPNQWYHVAGTYNNETGIMNLYIDGELNASVIYGGGIGLISTIGWIGANSNTGAGLTGYAFNGTIDEVRFSNKARTPNEFLLNPVNPPSIISRSLSDSGFLNRIYQYMITICLVSIIL
ncbi:LamG domain-containing protein [Candidatus Aenigmatarchaeota archaeon]